MDCIQEIRRSANELVRVIVSEAPRSVAVGAIGEMSHEIRPIEVCRCFSIGSRIELESRDLVFRGTVIKSSSSMTQGVDSAESVSIRIEHETWNCGTILVRKTV